MQLSIGTASIKSRHVCQSQPTFISKGRKDGVWSVQENCRVAISRPYAYGTVQSYFVHRVTVLQLGVMTITKVVLALGRRAHAAIKGAPLPAPMGPAQPLGDCGLVAAFDRALGATTVGPTESARLDATIASGNSASDRAALEGGITSISTQRKVKCTNYTSLTMAPTESAGLG
jgi:hypothetical protein